MTEPRVPIVGLDPDRVDPSSEAYGAAADGGVTTTKTALADCPRVGAARYAVDLSTIVPRETGSAELRLRVDARGFGYAVIGAGVRLD